MAEEFQAAVYDGNWYMSPRTACNCNYSSRSLDLANINNLVPFWQQDLIDRKSKSSDESSDESMVFHDIQKPGGRTTTVSPDSAFKMMATVLSGLVETATIDQNLLWVQDEMNTFSTSCDDGLKADIEAGHQLFTVNQQQSLGFATNSNSCTTFPISSTSYGYPLSLVQSFLSNLNSPPQSPSEPPQLPPQQALHNFHYTNHTPFLSASASPLDHHHISSFYPSSYKEKESFTNPTTKQNNQEIRDLGSSAKQGHVELPFKRPRLGTPSPLPSFKVRKEKLGDRITALQQLVSPFGKTDTASVLHEAIEYIKLLHDQVNILSAPYRKGATKQHLQAQDKMDGHKKDLRSLGLCLVPVYSTFSLATEMTTGFWTPSYEGSFK